MQPPGAHALPPARPRTAHRDVATELCNRIAPNRLLHACNVVNVTRSHMIGQDLQLELHIDAEQVFAVMVQRPELSSVLAAGCHRGHRRINVQLQRPWPSSGARQSMVVHRAHAERKVKLVLTTGAVGVLQDLEVVVLQGEGVGGRFLQGFVHLMGPKRDQRTKLVSDA